MGKHAEFSGLNDAVTDGTRPAQLVALEERQVAVGNLKKIRRLLYRSVDIGKGCV